MNLTPEQEAAATTRERRASVIAGAGSGKTAMLAARVSHLLSEGAEPASILPITFTRKAARELRERTGIGAGTFHATCLNVMRENGEYLNVVGEEYADKLLDECAVMMGVAVSTGDSVSYVRQNRAHWRRHLNAYRRRSDFSGSPITETYLSHLSMRGDIDHIGVLHRGLALAKAGCFSHIKHILLDEAQDTTLLQWNIIESIDAETIMAVGDPNQSLFDWAGADPEYFRDLPWTQYKLSRTFRCPASIVRLANSLPLNGVALRTTNDHTPIRITKGDDIEDVVSGLLNDGFSENDIAILCRYNTDVAEYRDRLSQYSVAISKPQDRGPLYYLLMYFANPQSLTAQAIAAKKWDVEGKISDWLNLPIKSCEMLCRYFVQQSDGSIRGIIDSLPIPMRMFSEAAGLRSDAPLMQWAIEESDVDVMPTSGITIDTIHKSKGGEWKAVVMPRLNWPKGDPTKTDCRIFNVGITRTMERLHVMHTDHSDFLGMIHAANIH